MGSEPVVRNVEGMNVTTERQDAGAIIKGIRLGGPPKVVGAVEDALAAAGGTLTVEELEEAARPEWDRALFEEYRDLPVSPGAEPVGLARLYGPEQTDAPGLPPSWAVAAAWIGWLPVICATREAALVTYGYVLGGERAGYLEELRDRFNRAERRPVTVEDLTSFAGEKGAGR